MDKMESRSGPLENLPAQERATESTQPGSVHSQPVVTDAVRIRANRAKRIEEISYRLTDLVTIVSGLVNILSDKVPSIYREDLRAIRNTAIKGAEFSKHLLQAARDCRREIGM